MELKVSCHFNNNLQPTNSNAKLLQCYGIFLTSRNLTCTRMKNTHQSRNDSVHQRTLQKTFPPQVWNGARTLASSPPMPSHKTVVYFPFPQQWYSLVSERPSSKNCITQGTVHRFVPLINTRPDMTQVPKGSHLRSYFSIEIMRTFQRHPNIWRPLYMLTIPKSKTNLALKMTITLKNLCKRKPDGLFENTLQQEKPQHVQTGPPARKANQCISFHTARASTKKCLRTDINFWKYFFILSACGPLLFLKTAKPSSRYRSMSFLLYLFES